MDIEVIWQRCGEKLPKFKDLISGKEKVTNTNLITTIKTILNTNLKKIKD